MAIRSHSALLQWEKIGKVAKWAKLAVPSHSVLFWWEKIGKVAKWTKLTILSHSLPLWWEKIGKVAKWMKLAIPSRSALLWWEKIGKVAKGAKVGHSESFCATLVGKDWKSSNFNFFISMRGGGTPANSNLTLEKKNFPDPGVRCKSVGFTESDYITPLPRADSCAKN